MVLQPTQCENSQTPKRRSGGAVEVALSAYETVINFYASLHSLYHWTQQEIDESDLMYLIDLLIVQSKNSNPEPGSFIEDHF